MLGQRLVDSHGHKDLNGVFILSTRVLKKCSELPLLRYLVLG